MDILKTIFSNGYKKFNNKPVSDSGVIELKKKIKECALKFLKGLERFGVLEDESVGRGTFANVPWIRFYYDDCAPSPKKGVYVVYLFAKDEEKLYLTLNQGVESSSIEQQKTVKENIWANISQSFFEKNTDKINSGNDGYDKSAIFYKKYEKDRLPSESEMKKDLEHMLEIYQKCKEKGILSSSTSLNSNPLVQIEKKVAENLNENINLVNSKNEKQLGTFSDSQTIQQIFFGAPGTGKSHTIKSEYLVDVSEDNIFRTTFHPDYDYAQFVGCYKPKKDDKDPKRIVYDFVPQVFAKAYKRAKETSEPVYLVIEEINRGNCAQIFGDIFQLLDRNESGESQYEIDVDSDFAEWLGESKIKLPPNFNILATMNTSDQSLFPMDSAFKRRFDWEYVPIDYKQEKANFFIEIGNEKYSWLNFLEKVNENIFEVTDSEDKQMGEFFVKPKNDKKIDLDMFLSKVMFYLWDSVYKDEPDRKKIFHFDWEFEKDKKLRVTFQRLFKDRDTTIKILQHMMDENLKVLKYTQQ